MSQNTKQHAVPMLRQQGSLDKQMLHVHMSMASTSLSSVLFTSRPITAALSKRGFQVWILFLSLFWVLKIRTCLSTLDGARVSQRLWKFTALELDPLQHHDLSHEQQSGVARIDLVSGNNVLPGQVQELGASIILKLDGESMQHVDGWCLTTREDHLRPDAVKFLLLASEDGVDWEEVGSSSSFIDSFGNVRHTNGLFRSSAELERNKTFCWSFAKDHFWVRCILVAAVIATALYWTGVGFAMAARENTCRIILGCAQMISAATMSCAAIAGISQGGFEAASDLIIAASCIFCYSYCFLIDEGAVLFGTTIISYIGIGVAFAHLICFHNVVLYTCTLVMNVGTCAFLKQMSRRRHRHLKESLALVKDDTIAHDTAWTSLSQRRPDAISKLQRLVDDAWQSRVTDLHQYQPIPSEPLSPITIRRRWSLRASYHSKVAIVTDQRASTSYLDFRRTQNTAENHPATAIVTVEALAGEDAILASAGIIFRASSSSLSVGSVGESTIAFEPLLDFTRVLSASRNKGKSATKGARKLVQPPSVCTAFPTCNDEIVDASICSPASFPMGREFEGEIGGFKLGGSSAEVLHGHDFFSSVPRSHFPPLGKRVWERRVSSLDALYEAAEAADPVLQSKVQEWAARTGGFFHRQKPPTPHPEPILKTDAAAQAVFEKSIFAPLDQFVRWESCSSSSGAETEEEPEEGEGQVEHAQQQVRWAKLKCPSRAVQKIYRSYGGDISHLTDVCRQSIVFTDLTDLSSCLSAILADPDVAVERIKNRYCPSYDSSVSAGYRDVALNLRLIGGRAQCLVEPHLQAGVEAHVCEVQLILADVASIKSDHGHANYVSVRDLLGQ